jgi:DNA repair exonuclease SbcCD nuclease subunit
MADTHLGAFRDPVLRQLNLEAFLRALDVVREERCHFLVIAGDLFDTTLPDMDIVERAADGLRRLGDAGVRVYVLYGSHDRSLTEKGIVDVLEAAGLFTNVGLLDLEDDRPPDLTVDGPTGTVLTAIGGRRLSLERTLFETTDWTSLEEAIVGSPLAIFGYHGPVEGMMPEELARLETVDRKGFPRGFDYYALGHVHHHAVKDVPGSGIAVYPSCTFGGTFTDLADGRGKGLVIVEADDAGKCTVTPVAIEMASIDSIDLDVEGRTAEEAREALAKLAEDIDPKDAIVLLRVHGTLSYGRPSDLSVPEVRTDLEERGARAVFVNRGGLRKAHPADVKGAENLEDLDRATIEDRTLEEAISDHDTPVPWLRGAEGVALARQLLNIAKEEQGDLSAQRYLDRVKGRAMEVLALHERPGPEAEGGVDG